MKENTVAAIKAALKKYDGCEFDIRLTKDRQPVLHHNANYYGLRIIENKLKDLKAVNTLEQLVSNQDVIDLVNKKGKTLWIEAKEESRYKLKHDPPLCKKIGKAIMDQLHTSSLELDKVHIISFSPLIIDQLSGIKKIQIVPYLYSHTDVEHSHYTARTFMDMFTNFKLHIKRAKARGHDGLFFSKLFFQGPFSTFQPKLKDMIKYAGKDFILGLDSKTAEEEKRYSDLVVVTDYRGKRGNYKRAGQLVAHRGL